MTSRMLRVGIIGANATEGWGRESHVPAIRQVTGLELVAVGTQRQQTADAAAEAFGVGKAYGDAMALTRDPDIDLVSIVVRLPAHRDYVLSALKHGKHVYCEWPLGVDLAETQELFDAARGESVKTAIGLQSRGDPAVRLASDVIAGGRLGRIVRARIRSTVGAWGGTLPEAVRYANDPASGVHLLSIQGAHTLDLASALLGPMTDLSALVSTTYPRILIGRDAQPVERQVPDHLLVNARIAGGAPLGLEVTHVAAEMPPFVLEVVGEQATLSLDGGAPRGAQAGRYALSIDGQRQILPDDGRSGLPEGASGVAGLYASLRDDILQGTSGAPGFAHALALARLLDAVERASVSGRRQTSSEWPAPL